MSWLRRTGQFWKLALFAPVLCANVILAVLAFHGIYRHPLVDLVNGAVFVIALLWFFRSIRCPLCGAAVGWKLLTWSKAGALWGSMLDLDVCPVCHDDPVVARSPPPPGLFSAWRP
jgi:hypothetical protein